MLPSAGRGDRGEGGAGCCVVNLQQGSTLEAAPAQIQGVMHTLISLVVVVIEGGRS